MKASLRIYSLIYFTGLFALILMLSHWVNSNGLPWTSVTSPYMQQRIQLSQEIEEVSRFKKNYLVYLLEKMKLQGEKLAATALIKENVTSFYQPAQTPYQNILPYLKFLKSQQELYDVLYIVDKLTGVTILSTGDYDFSQSLPKNLTTTTLLTTDQYLFTMIPILGTQAILVLQSALLTFEQRLQMRVEAGTKTTLIAMPTTQTPVSSPMSNVLSVYKTIPIDETKHWALIVQVKVDKETEILKAALNKSFWIYTSIILIVGSIGLFFYLRYLLRPINALTRVIQKVRSGNFAARSKINRQDEIGLLALTTNNMLARFQASYEEMEHLITERTAELYKTNVSLAVTLDELQTLNTQLENEITMRKSVEAEIRQQQRQQQLIFDTVPAFIWHKDLQNNILWMNKAAAKLCGVTHTSQMSYALFELFPSMAKTAYKEDLEVIQTKQPKRGIIKHLESKNNEKLWIQIDKVPLLDGDNHVTGVIVLGTDITERITAELTMHEVVHRFRSILDSAIDGIVTIDIHGTIQLVNPALANMFGYTVDELLGQSVETLIPSPHKEQHAHYIQTYLKTGQKKILGTSKEVIGLHKSGKIFPIYLAISELQLKDEHLFTAIITDISALKHAQLELEQSTQRLEIQNAAYSRFIPTEFLNFLGKDNIAEVQLGDLVQQPMTVMFSNIHSFSDLSVTMTPQQNFAFLNDYLSRVEPLILSHHGFIHKLIGDTSMSLFPHQADDAMQCAISILHTLNEFNRQQIENNKPVIKIGLGLHTDMLMLGTIGGQHHMDNTVISEAVNLAAYVEKLTKIYGTSLLITEQTYNCLQIEYDVRIVDKVKGAKQSVIIFEVLDGEFPEIRRAKLETLELFTHALSAYHRRHFSVAEREFQVCLERNPHDKVVEIYIKRCQLRQKLDIGDKFGINSDKTCLA